MAHRSDGQEFGPLLENWTAEMRESEGGDKWRVFLLQYLTSVHLVLEVKQRVKETDGARRRKWERFLTVPPLALHVFTNNPAPAPAWFSFLKIYCIECIYKNTVPCFLRRGLERERMVKHCAGQVRTQIRQVRS